MATQQDNNAILDRVYDALNRHDPDAVAALAADDVTVDDVAAGRVVTGRQAVAQHYRNFFRAFPDAHYSSTHRSQQRDTIVDEWVIRGTHRGELHIGKMVVQPTNRPFELRGVSVLQFSGGQVRHHRIYYDVLTVSRQLGLDQMLQARAVGE